MWLEELSQRAGKQVTLGTVPDAEWDRLAVLGFDLVWLMGVWERSAVGRQIARTDSSLWPSYDEALPSWRMEHVVGSGYSVKAYRPDPRIAPTPRGWDELDAVREKLCHRGIGLVLDFVTNHTGRDHAWVLEHPEYYVQGTERDFREDPGAFFLVDPEPRRRVEPDPNPEASGRSVEPEPRAARSAPSAGKGPLFLACGRDPFFPPWADTAQLNYFHPGTRRAAIEQLKSIAQHCDGVRCDMAMLELNEVFGRTWAHLLRGTPAPLTEFWDEATASLSGLVWIAEVYWDMEWRMQQLGFQFTYDKRLLDRLHFVAPGEVRAHLRAEWEYQNRLVRFLENHDEARSALAIGKERLPAAATLVATLPGMRLYQHGQFEGRKIRPPVQLSAAAEEPPDPELRAFYERLLRITDADVFHSGEWTLLDVHPAGENSHENLIAYEWQLQGARRVVVVNLGSVTAQGVLRMGGLDRGRKFIFHDELNDERHERDGEELERHGLFVRLEPNRAHVFAVTE